MSKPKGYRVLNKLAKSGEEWLEKRIFVCMYFEHLYSILSLDVNEYRHAACA